MPFRRFCCIAYLFFIAFLHSIFAPGFASAETYCVGPEATGNGTGSDWKNQKGWNSTPVRGDTWYLAGGNYLSKTFDTPNSSSTIITIKKASPTDHFTDVGWNTTAASQAVINGSIEIDTNYWIITGSYRNEDDWFDTTAYGILVQQPPGDSSSSVKYFGSYSTISYVAVKANPVTASWPATNQHDYQFDWYSPYYTGAYPSPSVAANVSHCLVSGGNNHYYMHWTQNSVLEYSGSTGLSGNELNHAECVNWYASAGWLTAVTARYNKFYHNSSTTGTTAMIAVTGTDNSAIYGNVFYDCANGTAAIGWGGDNAAYATKNLKIYNNTFIGHVGNWPNGIYLEPHSTGCIASNNLWYDAHTPNFIGVTHDYNAADGAIGETNGQTLTETPDKIFQNYSGGDFRLKAETKDGTHLSGPYDIDMLGTKRGTTTWSRGAYQFQGGAAKPPTPNNLRIQSSP